MLELIHPRFDVSGDPTPGSGFPAHVGAVSTTRFGGVSLAPWGPRGLNLGDHVGDDARAVASNRRLLQREIAARPVWLSQVHGSTVIDAATAPAGAVTLADASFSTEPGVACAILTADCLPVLFCDTAGKVVGAAHAGWRGLAGGVLQNTVAAMRAAGAGEILAWLGPAIGAARFEVGADVVAAFAGVDAPGAFRPVEGRDDKFLSDIYRLARAALAAEGVTRVAGGDRCTVSEDNVFYSYRRDGLTGRQASLIWLDSR
jgi:YfiH family protein